MSLLRLPVRPHDCGCVHVMGNRHEGFFVSHESRSGDSWGGMEGPFNNGQDAIATAYSMARDQYGGCEVYICPAASAEVRVGDGRGCF